MSHEAPRSAARFVAEAKQRVENLTPEQVLAEVERGDAVLVDIRDGEERQQDGSIAGAIHASRGMLEFRADPTSPYHRKGLDPNKRTILHCASGGRSALAVETLEQLGYKNVAHLAGGLKAWREAGLPIAENGPGA